MSVIQNALSYGYQANEILQTLSQQSKEFESIIKKATSFGYGADEILKYLASNLKGQKGAKFAKNLGFNKREVKNLIFDQDSDPATFIQRSLGPSELTQKAISGLGSLGATAGAAGLGYAIGGAPLSRAAGFIGDQISQAFGGKGSQETAQPQEAQQPQRQEGQSYLGRALQGKDFSSLDPKVKNRVITLGRKLEEFQNKGLPYEDPKVQRVVERVNQILGTSKTGIVARETERFDKEYPDTEAEGVEQIEKIAPKLIDRSQSVERIKKEKNILDQYISEIGNISIPSDKPLQRSAKEIAALKSSNVRYADYDPDKEHLQVLFAPSKGDKPGEIYEYFDVPKNDVDNFFKGADTATTTGENKFRYWFRGKNPSIGAAFDEFIKQKNDKGEFKYPYRKIGTEAVKDKDLLKVRDADKIFLVSQYLDSFEKLTQRSKAKQKTQELKLKQSYLKDIDDDIIADLLIQVEDELKLEGKKRIKGGKSAEIERRVLERIK